MPKVEHDGDLASDVMWPGVVEDVVGAPERGWVLLGVIGGHSGASRGPASRQMLIIP